MAINCVTYPNVRVIYCNDSGYKEFVDRWERRNHEYMPGDARAWRYLERYNTQYGATSFNYQRYMVLRKTPWLVKVLLKRRAKPPKCVSCPMPGCFGETGGHEETYLALCVEYCAKIRPLSWSKRLAWLLSL